MSGFNPMDRIESFPGVAGYAKYVSRRSIHDFTDHSLKTEKGDGCRCTDEYLYRAGVRWFVRRMNVTRAWTYETDSVHTTTVETKKEPVGRRWARDFMVELAKERLEPVIRWRAKTYVEDFLRSLARLRKHFPREAARLRRSAVYALRKQGRTLDFCTGN